MGNKPEVDAAFVASLQQQDRAAFCRLVQLFQKRLVGFAGSMVGIDAAEDVVQEAWLAAWKGLPGFEGRAALSTWLYTIVRHACIARLRKDKPVHNSAADIDSDDEVAAETSADGIDDWFDHSFTEDGHRAHAMADWHMNTPEALLEEKQLQRCIEHHIKALQPMQRAVFQLRDLDQVELDAICNMLQLTHSNVRVLLHRARLRLQQVMDHYQQTGEC